MAMMNDEPKLSDNHRRVISSRIQMMVRSIAELERILSQPEQSPLNQKADILDDQKVKVIKSQLHHIQNLLIDLATRYQLKFYKKSQQGMVLSRLSNLLDSTENLYAEKLKGYGTFPEDIKESYNEDIEKIEHLLKQTLKPFEKH